MFDKNVWNQLAQHHGVTEGDLTLKALLASHRAQAERIAQLEGALQPFERKFFRYQAGEWVWTGRSKEDELVTESIDSIFKAVEAALTPTPTKEKMDNEQG